MERRISCIHGILINSSLVYLTNFRSAKHLVGIIAVSVFMGSHRHRLRLTQRDIFFRSVGKAKCDIALSFVHVVSAKSKLAFKP